MTKRRSNARTVQQGKPADTNLLLPIIAFLVVAYLIGGPIFRALHNALMVFAPF